MKNLTFTLLIICCLIFPINLIASECLEGNCENGFGTGFTHNKVFEGEWKDGLPHGKGKLIIKKGEVIEGVWEKGKLVERTGVEEKKEVQEGK